MIALTTMFLAHRLMSRLYRGSRRAHAAIQNPPILVVADGQPLPEQLRHARLAGFELRQLLRQHGYGAFDGLRAVVLEPTGRLSVVPTGAPISTEFIVEVVGAHRLDVEQTDGP